MDTTRLLRFYYLATPVFFLIDIVLHAPVRAAFLPDRRARWLFYAVLLGCGIVSYVRPSLTKPIGVIESGADLLLLALGVLLPIWDLPAAIAAGGGTAPEPGPVLFANAALAGAALLLATMRSNRSAALRR